MPLVFSLGSVIVSNAASRLLVRQELSSHLNLQDAQVPDSLVELLHQLDTTIDVLAGRLRFQNFPNLFIVSFCK